MADVPQVDREWLERELAKAWKGPRATTAVIPSVMSNGDREALRNAAEHVYGLGFADGARTSAIELGTVRHQLAKAEEVIEGYGRDEPPIVKGALDAQAEAEEEVFALRAQLRKREAEVERLKRIVGDVS